MTSRRGRRGARVATRDYGYQGTVTLVSPTGETITVKVPGRTVIRYRRANGFAEDRDVLLLCTGYGDRTVVERRDRRFHRLLSRGWCVVGRDVAELGGGQSQPDKAADFTPEQSEPEGVDEVVEATSLTSEDVHGGNEATKDVEDSPNPADNGQNPDNNGAAAGQDEQGAGEGSGGVRSSEQGSQGQQRPPRGRGSRGGRSDRRKAERAEARKDHQRRERYENVQQAGRHGSTGVLCLQSLDVSPEMRRSAQLSAELLAKLVGRSAQKTIQGTQVDVLDLLFALETGDNPLPALERPRERPSLKVLITPDTSGSCQDWSGVGRAWALEIAKLPDVDVTYVENMNGELLDSQYRPISDTEIDTMLRGVDVVIYLGDDDGHYLCYDYASRGATVVALDSYCASVAKPRLREAQRCGAGAVYWVDKVSSKNPDTWYDGLNLVLERQFV